MSQMVDNTKFVLWLLLLSGSSSCFGSDLDVQCLKTVQQSVIDPNGILNSSWFFNDSYDGFICQFTGVECWRPDENRVLTLRLNDLGLQGQFPQGLHNCTSMTGLDLSSNNFSGETPSDIARQVPFLTSLDLSYTACSLVGFWADKPGWCWFVVREKHCIIADKPWLKPTSEQADNSFSGEIPVVVSKMSYLNTLNLQDNRLSGEILWEFSFLDRLEEFNVADNQLSGPIPFSLTKFLASNFAGNQGLCGAPLLTKCDDRSRISNEFRIGAAAGFVVGFVVAFYLPRLFVFSQRLHPYVVRI